jgi:hypothetical protein
MLKKIMLKIREGKTSCSSVPCKCSLSWYCILVNNNASMHEFTRSIPAGVRMILSGRVFYSLRCLGVSLLRYSTWSWNWLLLLHSHENSNNFIFCFRVNIIVNWVAWKTKRPAGRYLKPGNCIVPPFFSDLVLRAHLPFAETSTLQIQWQLTCMVNMSNKLWNFSRFTWRFVFVCHVSVQTQLDTVGTTSVVTGANELHDFLV